MWLFIQTFPSNFSVIVKLRFIDHLRGLLILTTNSKHKRCSKVHGRRWSLLVCANILIPSCQYFYSLGSSSFERGKFSSNSPSSCCSFDSSHSVTTAEVRRPGSCLGSSHGLGSTVWISLVDDVKMWITHEAWVVGKAEQIIRLECGIFSLACLALCGIL